MVFSKVALIPESQELRIEGRVIGTNAGGARSGVSVFIGKESTLKHEMIPSAQAITDPEGWFAVQGKVESGDRLYICEVKRPVKEYALGEFVEELEAFYRVVPKESLNQHPLDGRWIIEMGEPHFLKGRYEFSPYWVYLVELEVKDNQIGGHTIPPQGHLELKIHGEVSKKGISVVFTNLGVVDSKGLVDPFGGTQVNLILKGELHHYTLRGSWEDTNDGEETEGKWIAYRVKEESEQNANSLSGKP